MPELRRAERAIPNPERVKPADRPDQYPKGRRCREPGCITFCCIFNPGPYCYLHASKHAAEVEEQARIDKRRKVTRPMRAAIAAAA